ncbi:MAG: AAA family ATPase [Bacteroides oleiciplenus]|uniref:AAA family ATPase n=1 Tax=Bacteroides stercorirosoris TaxID=871324 RepID=A0A413GJD8_9BACE|nr:ATP-binding protein [Bacteroides stercorirosoris]OKZ07658.1 MAG: AAA family ATPase [Bacteroides oleiciplenus]RGX71267.1 AAA family ATPase [Bacteroides stercorirosoris]
MEQQRRLYPIGIQTFSEIRGKNYLYIDKTEYVYRMTHFDSKYVFLSRPRRFGKSLLTSTLHVYFEGRKELFEGLAIDKMETEWSRHPVLHFDMSMAKHVDKERLEQMLSVQLYRYEETYGKVNEEVTLNDRFSGLIRRIYHQTGRQVVVLIDEYDAPLLDVVHEEKNLPVLRDVMRNFYSPLKACDPYLRFVFLTGITKFSQLSIFSELNNIKNISMDGPYAAICGISEEEMLTQMDSDLDVLAVRMGLTREEVLAKLKDNYDGYHFTWPSPDIYNPFSLLNAFADGKMNSYWFGSGTPTYLIEMLNKYHVIPQQIGDRKALAESFDAPTERITNITPLLYQSGYITIKGYSPITNLYLLDIPNKEVRLGLMKSLLPGYLHQHTMDGLTTVALLYEAIYEERLDDGLRLLQTFLSTIPYCDNTDYEGHYQSLLYTIFSLLGMYVDVEVRTPRGRVDVVMRSLSALYVIELKLDKSADAAMNQINLKNYPERFALCGLPMVKVGINFDSERRTLGEWKIEMVH